jgi:hypothetical protein
MNGLYLHCSLQKCNIDGSKEMSIDRCILRNNTPCYYLLIKETSVAPEDEAWRKFDRFVGKSKSSK